MTSVIIAAHNEATVIGRCLDALFSDHRAEDGELEVIVVPNGCSDDTAAVAARHGARVIEVPTAGKANAMNAGDAAARTFPRIYLDADIVVPVGGVRRLIAALDGADAVLAAVPQRRLDVAGRPWVVRGYFAVNARHPRYRHSLFGRGMIALSEAGRTRFGAFPAVVADDLYLDAQFRDGEKRVVPDVVVTIATPRRTRDLVRRLIRVRSGNAGLRRAAGAGEVTGAIAPSSRSAWLKDVVLTRPWLWPAGIIYLAITAYASLRARGQSGSGDWGHDESTRVAS